MNDPKPQLSPATIRANILYYHSQLDNLDTQKDLLREQLEYWTQQLETITASSSSSSHRLHNL